jgi:hypothetical protein
MATRIGRCVMWKVKRMQALRLVAFGLGKSESFMRAVLAAGRAVRTPSSFQDLRALVRRCAIATRDTLHAEIGRLFFRSPDWTPKFFTTTKFDGFAVLRVMTGSSARKGTTWRTGA